MSLQRSNNDKRPPQQITEPPETGKKRRLPEATSSGPSGTSGKKTFSENQPKRLKVMNRQSKLGKL